MAIFIYNLLLFLLSPLIYAYLLFRRSKGKEDATHWHERWGKYSHSSGAGTWPALLQEASKEGSGARRFWVHAVSVGEVMAAVPVLRELRRRYPDAFLLLSTTTPTGREVALKQLPPADTVVYFPLDFLWTARRALTAVRPDVILLMEWEIWPNFLVCAAMQKTRIAVLNGRISEKGLRRGLKARFFTRPGLDAVTVFCMQSAEDARRAALVGVAPEKIHTLGNTKFDEAAAMLSPDERADLRADLGIPDNIPVWVCGSTRPGEEVIIVTALELVRQSFPDLVLIVAPRHLDRTEEVETLFQNAGLPTVRRSEIKQQQGDNREETEGRNHPTPNTQYPTPHTSYSVLLLDTFGELAKVYAVGQVAFVGGSLKPFGGQSVFQPLAQGVPTLFGPYMNNQRDIATLATAEGVGFAVTDAATLAAEVVRLLSLGEPERHELSQKCRALIERNQGVTARSLDTVEAFL